jgi:signal transduction histidine kinase
MPSVRRPGLVVPDFTIAADMRGVILRWHPEAESLFGLAASEMFGRPLSLLFLDGESLLQDILVELRRVGRCWRYQTIRKAVESDASCGIVATLLRDRSGEPYIELGVYSGYRGGPGEIVPHRALDTLDRFAFLAEVGSRLGTSLDVEITLKNIAALVVPNIADFFMVDLVQGDRLVRSVVAHVDTSVERSMNDLREQFTLEMVEMPALIADVFRKGRPLLMKTMSPEALRELSYDSEHLAYLKMVQPVSAMVVPLSAHTTPFGVITVAMGESGRSYNEIDLDLVEEFARRAAAAIENATLYRAAQKESRDRMRAEGERADMVMRETKALADVATAERRLRFVARASAVLASSLDYQTTLTNVATLMVPELADWCAIDIIEGDGSVKRLAIAHSDPEKLAWAAEMQSKFVVDADPATGIGCVLRTGRSELFETVSDEMLVASARSEEELAFVRQLGIASVIIVPLLARGRTLGAITLVHAESGRRYDASDRALAEDIAGRAAIAVDNALLYQQAEQARIDAEGASRTKDQFLAVLSHELRTPLNPILISTQALEADSELPDHLRPLVEVMRRNIELEARLIDDLLDLTRITRGRLSLNNERVDVHAVIDLVIGIARPALESAHLRLICEPNAHDHMVVGDQARLQQVLWNLVQNAVKFTPPGGSIGVRTTNDAPGHIRIDVFDSGIGIEPQMLDRIFGAFEQGEKTSLRRYGGLGVGLTIAKALVEAHGGTITAESAGIDRGATFTIGLNTQTSAGMNPTNTTDGEMKGGVRILLVDDHEDTNMVLKLLLQRKGYMVFTAHDVKSALEVADQHEFDVLVSDIGLPDGTGLDLMRALLDRYPIKGIALSGFGMEDDIRRSREAGFSDHLVKPVNPQRLQEVIQQVTS